MSRINCHSGYQHYEMLHSRHCGGGNYGSIFNTTYNIKCSGSHTGGFWGGFGIGLGNAFGGWLSGFLGGGNMFSGNMFSSIPMFGGGMFTGFPSWNNSWNLSGLLGNREKKADKSNESDKSSKPDSNSKAAECKDPDRQKIVDYGNEAKTLLAKPAKEINAKDLKTLYDKIKEDQNKSKTEGHHNDTDPKDYQNWLDLLKNKANELGFGDIESADFGKTKAPAAQAQVAPAQDETSAKKITPTAGNENSVEPSFTIDGKPVKLSELTNEQIGKMTKEDINKLSPEEAKTLLNKLNLVNDDNKVKATTNYQALLLTEKSGLPLACGHNIKLDNVSGADAYIEGTISNVTLNENDKTISFEIEDDNVKLQMSCKADDSKYHIAEMIENKTKKYKGVTTGTEYEIKNNDNDDYAVRNGEAAIK